MCETKTPDALPSSATMPSTFSAFLWTAYGSKDCAKATYALPTRALLSVQARSISLFQENMCRSAEMPVVLHLLTARTHLSPFLKDQLSSRNHCRRLPLPSSSRHQRLVIELRQLSQPIAAETSAPCRMPSIRSLQAEERSESSR